MIIWVLISFLLLLAIGGPLVHRKKREWFERNQNIVEYEGVLISLIIALFTINQTQKGIDSSTTDFNKLIGRLDKIVTKVDNATQSVSNVEKSLSKLPSEIDTFSNSINSLNNVVKSQKEQLNKSLTDFNFSIQAFKSSVDSMVKRFNRKPLLDVDVDISAKDSIITHKQNCNHKQRGFNSQCLYNQNNF